MEISNIDNILTIHFDMATTLAVAGLVWILGMTIQKNVKFLRKYCIPAPVVGGFLFMLLSLGGYASRLFVIDFDVTFQNFFMVVFFTCVGLSADFKSLKHGGKILIIYWLCAGFISIMQIPISIGIGNLCGMDKCNSIMAGSISMCGGHGCATAYGHTLANLGYPSSLSCGLAAATLGLITSVIIGGPIARRLILKHNLKPDPDDLLDIDSMPQKSKNARKKKLSNTDIAKNVAAILFCMAVGTNLARLLDFSLENLLHTSITIPEYLGAMIFAVVFRNFNTRFNWYRFSNTLNVGCETVSLSIFLSIAMMAIKLWELAGAVAGLIVIVLVQVTIMGLYTYFIVFRLLGKNYNAAVMCAGLCGHGLGATPTAMANMDAVFVQYGFTKTPTIVVSLVGGFLNDIFYQTANIVTINMLLPSII